MIKMIIKEDKKTFKKSYLSASEFCKLDVSGKTSHQKLQSLISILDGYYVQNLYVAYSLYKGK